MKRYKAVFFDLDGVLGKTMEDNFRAWEYAFLQWGVPIEREKYFLMEGKSPRKVVEHFLPPDRSSPDLIQKIADLKEEYYLKHNSFTLYEGAKSLLKDLGAKGFLLGLVTGASRKRFSQSRAKILLDFFDVVITGDDCPEGKPSPAPYRLAASTLQVSSADCLVVENAPLGIDAAKGAGMTCIAITSTLESCHLKKADRIVSQLSDIRDFLWNHQKQ